jgi:FtsZ-binding cell division protein ZapB
MTAWDDRFTSSQTLVLANQLPSVLADLPAPREDEELEAQQRVAEVADLVRAIVVNANPRLVSPRMLADAQTPLSQLVNALQTYVSGSDITYLTNANSYADEVLGALGGWIQRPAREARQTVAALGRDAEAVIASLRGSGDQVLETIAALQARVEEINGQANSTVQAAEASAQEAIRALEKKITDVQAELDAEKLRIDAAVRDADSSFKTSQDTRDKQFKDALDAFTAQHQEVLSNEREAGAEAATSRARQTDETMTSLRSLLGDAEKVTSAVAGKAVSDGFGNSAQRENRTAWILFAFGSILIGAVVVFGYLELQGGSHPSLDLWWIALRVLIVLPLVGLAVYAFAQGSNHRQQERIARSTQLQFAAFDPFLASLDDPEQARLRGIVAERAFFAASTEAARGGTGEVTKKDVFDLLRDAMKLIGRQ